MTNGILGTLRLIGILAVVMLGALALLTVLDIVPRESLQNWAVKLVLVCAIVAAVTLAIAALTRRGPGH